MRKSVLSLFAAITLVLFTVNSFAQTQQPAGGAPSTTLEDSVKAVQADLSKLAKKVGSVQKKQKAMSGQIGGLNTALSSTNDNLASEISDRKRAVQTETENRRAAVQAEIDARTADIQRVEGKADNANTKLNVAAGLSVAAIALILLTGVVAFARSRSAQTGESISLNQPGNADDTHTEPEDVGLGAHAESFRKPEDDSFLSHVSPRSHREN